MGVEGVQDARAQRQRVRLRCRAAAQVGQIQSGAVDLWRGDGPQATQALVDDQGGHSDHDRHEQGHGLGQQPSEPGGHGSPGTAERNRQQQAKDEHRRQADPGQFGFLNAAEGIGRERHRQQDGGQGDQPHRADGSAASLDHEQGHTDGHPEPPARHPDHVEHSHEDRLYRGQFGEQRQAPGHIVSRPLRTHESQQVPQ